MTISPLPASRLAKRGHPTGLLPVVACLAVFAHGFGLALASQDAGEPPRRWWKGNLHTHSLWSDGDDYPEMIAAWYKDRGYHFLAFTEHNVFAEGQRWFTVTDKRGGGVALEKYRARFGDAWVQQRSVQGTNQVRLKPLSEFRSRFEEPGRFLLIPAEEITDRHLVAPLHLNAINIRDLVPPQGGSNVVDVLQRNVAAVLEQRRLTGQPMFPHINHPNFGWAITAEELMQVQDERFFEVYNGHPSVRNDGDAQHAGMERMWDIILTWRLAILGFPPMFGLAVDDSHNYHAFDIPESNPGRGWTMVRCQFLTAESIIEAMEAGDFYSTSGVLLRDIRRHGDTLHIDIEPESGVTYRTEFIGTRTTFNRDNSPIRNAAGDPLRLTHQYSDDVGQVLGASDGLTPSYTFRGDELYVRARITSSQPKENPYRAGETERAWTQPVRP